jgi:hypothetical protein
MFRNRFEKKVPGTYREKCSGTYQEKYSGKYRVECSVPEYVRKKKCPENTE